MTNEKVVTMVQMLVIDYSAYLKQLLEGKEAAMKQYKLAMAEDEAKFSKVELNIIMIFEKMFHLSIKGVSDDLRGLEMLEEKYLSYFSKIPVAWEENLEKCIQFKHHEEAHIERLKLKQAQVLREKFSECSLEVRRGRTS